MRGCETMPSIENPDQIDCSFGQPGRSSAIKRQSHVDSQRAIEDSGVVECDAPALRWRRFHWPGVERPSPAPMVSQSSPELASCIPEAVSQSHVAAVTDDAPPRRSMRR